MFLFGPLWRKDSRHIGALIIACLLCGAASVRAQTSDYQAATSLVQQGQFERAIALLEQVVGRSPGDLKARNLIGIALSAAGRRDEANEQFQKAVALDPNFVPALKNLAVNELAAGRLEQAAIHFEKVLKSVPVDQACHWGLAEIAFARRDFQRAVDHYEQSGELSLREPSTTIRFASSYAETKQSSKAVALMQKVPLGLDANAQFQAGLLLAKLERYEEAARRFELARKTYPDPYQVGYNLVLVLVRSRDYDAAVRTGEELLAAGHRKAELYNLMAAAYDRAGKTIEAYNSLRRATELEPNDETNYLDLIALCLERQNYDLGLKIADLGVELIPASGRLHLQRGVVLVMKGQFEEATTEFEISARTQPEPGLAYVAMGLALIQMDKPEAAVEMLRRQIEKSPNNPRLWWLLGEGLTRGGAASMSDAEREAIEALRKSIRLDPAISQPRALLGKILLRRGDVGRAAEQLEKALEIDPDDLTAAYQLAQALRKKGDTARANLLFARVDRAKSEGRDDTQRNLMQVIKAGSR